ncbi:MAG: flavohemoglobin expression-modulating QEGLA motif protein, partial [Polyangiaceae bacterium]|nr:flavohemoglobin expression-modulating QEGLA motif protein [Polyangiaceae bacterium]
ALDALLGSLAGPDPLAAYLRSLATSYRDANEMLLAVGTRRFYELSLVQYGGALSRTFDEHATNLDLALHLGSRLGHTLRKSPGAELPAEAFVQAIEQRLAEIQPGLDVKVVLDESIAPKVIAGARRVRVRTGALFSPLEVESLFAHEIETHALTAQNGMLQRHLPFLRAGGPRTTRTQEGLAVFAELFDRSLSVDRLRRLVERVRMVAMAEDGASFLDVYRHLLDLGADPREAYLDTVRIFRGGLVEGAAPFTKDAAYLAGLAEVYNFLRLSLVAGSYHVAETLISGRLALDDIPLLVALREEGLVEPPRHLPRWLARWEALLPYFAFTSFLNDLDFRPANERYERLSHLPPAPPSQLLDDPAPEASPG